MPAVGKLEAFDASTTEFAEYQERVLMYLLVHDVAEEKKSAVFLTSCGTATYSLLRSLLAPTKPGEATLTEIFAALNAHFKPRVSEAVASFKFFSRRRHEGEAVSDYVAALNKLVDDCNFGTTRDRMMRDQIVSGINDTGMQTRLLESSDLNLESAKQLVIAMEAARKDAHTLCPQPESAAAVEPTNFVEPPRRNAANAVERGCDRCGDKHQTSRCRHRASTCFKCGRQGHIARACRAAPTGSKNRMDSRSVHQMDDLQETQPEVDKCAMWSLRSTGPGPTQIKAIVNDVPLSSGTTDLAVNPDAADTTASTTVIHQQTPVRRGQFYRHSLPRGALPGLDTLEKTPESQPALPTGPDAKPSVFSEIVLTTPAGKRRSGTKALSMEQTNASPYPAPSNTTGHPTQQDRQFSETVGLLDVAVRAPKMQNQ
ncbi:uncharacterized protein ISCGN_014753 [Ixodes scapularis]